MAGRFESIPINNRKYQGPISIQQSFHIPTTNNQNLNETTSNILGDLHQNNISVLEQPQIIIPSKHKQILTTITKQQFVENKLAPSLVGVAQQYRKRNSLQQSRIKRYSPQSSTVQQNRPCPWWFWLILGPLVVLTIGGLIMGCMKLFERQTKIETKSSVTQTSSLKPLSQRRRKPWKKLKPILQKSEEDQNINTQNIKPSSDQQQDSRTQQQSKDNQEVNQAEISSETPQQNIQQNEQSRNQQNKQSLAQDQSRGQQNRNDRENEENELLSPPQNNQNNNTELSNSPEQDSQQNTNEQNTNTNQSQIQPQNQVNQQNQESRQNKRDTKAYSHGFHHLRHKFL